jgi:hypothetical protein
MSAALASPPLLLAPLGGRGRVRGASPRRRLAARAACLRFASPLTQPSPEGEGFELLLLAPLGGRGRVRGASPPRGARP